MSAANFPENEQQRTAAATSIQRNSCASDIVADHLPHDRDALFMHMTLKSEVRHLLEMAPTLSHHLSELLKRPISSKKKMAEMGVIEAYFEQNHKLEHVSFVDHFMETGGDLASLLFDFLGMTSEARKAAVLTIADHLGLPGVAECVNSPSVMRMLSRPIQIHPSLNYFFQGHENVQRPCIDALFRLPARVDAHFFPLASLLNWLLETLCNGQIVLDEYRLPIAQMHIDTLPELMLYMLRLHDANFGNFLKGRFIEASLDHLKGRFPSLPRRFFDRMMQQLYQRLWFEERKEGVVKPFLLVDGQYIGLHEVSALQRTFALLCIECKHESGIELLRNYATSDAFKAFLLSYAQVHNPQAKEGQFALTCQKESSPETLAQALACDLQLGSFDVMHEMDFLHKLNKIAHSSPNSDILFVGTFRYVRKEAELFTVDNQSFHAALLRKLYLPLKEKQTDMLLLKSTVLQKIYKRTDVPPSLSGTPFSIAKALASKESDLLPLMQKIERHARLPVTIAVGRFGDNSRLVCKMNLATQKPEFYKLSTESFEFIDFRKFRNLRTGVLSV